MITLDSPIVGFVGGDHDWPEKPKRPLELADYFGELFRLCKAVNFDYRILLAQAWHETDGFKSHWWETRLNPCGLAITGDPAQNAASPTFATGTDAARAHVVHMWAYSTLVLPAVNPLVTYIPLDPRYEAVFDAGLDGTVRVLGDLGNGKWAVDPDYAPQIAAKANAIFKEAAMPDSLTFGAVPYPIVEPSHLPASNPWLKTSGAPAVPLAVVWHRMVGTLRGTDSYFHAGNAATAYGIGCAATDAQPDAGRIIEWIAPRSGWYGESSGPVNQPYGDGLALVNKVGVNAVNRTTVAIEISGNYDTPLDDACRSALVNLTAYWADQAKIPYDQFPTVPGENRSFVCWHQEFCIGTGKICPGPVVMNETPALIAAVAGVLKRYQTKPAPEPVPTVPWGRDATGVHRVNDVPCLAFLGEATARKDGVIVRTAASSKSPVLTKLKAGQKVTVRGSVRNANRWLFIDLGEKGVGRALASNFAEKWPTL